MAVYGSSTGFPSVFDGHSDGFLYGFPRIKEEIGRRGMHWVIETFWSHDFEMFGLEDVETFPKYQHDSLGKRCKKGDMPSRMHSKAVLAAPTRI